MSEQEVRETLRMHRWSFLRRERGQRSYIYAARKQQGKRQEVYVGPIANLGQLTADQLMVKMRIVAIMENVS